MTGPDNLNRPEEIVDRLLSLAGKTHAEEYEAYLVRKSSLAIAVKEGQVDQVRRNDEVSAALRLIDHGRLGFAYTSVFTPEALKRTADQAAAGAELTGPQPELGLPVPPPQAWPEVDAFDPDLAKITLTDKINRVRGMEAVALDLDRRVEKVRQAEYGEAEFSVRLANSHGLNHHHSGTVVSGSLMVKAVQGAEAEMGYESDFARRYQDLDLGAIGRDAAARAVDSLGGRKVPTGRASVILENRVAAEFLDVLSASFLADNVQKGKSILAGRVGQKIMAGNINLVDDGLYPGGLASSPADAEGTPCQKTILVSGGRLVSFLYDYSRARLDGAASTGNADRGGAASPPGIGPTNLYLAPGTKSPGELAALMGEGLLVTEAMGVHTADPISGDFSLGVSGFWIRAGQLDHPVKGMALAGNIFKMFDQAAEAGSDLRFFGSTGAPSLLIHELTLSGL